jgi:hypothetical protein
MGGFVSDISVEVYAYGVLVQSCRRLHISAESSEIEITLTVSVSAEMAI